MDPVNLNLEVAITEGLSWAELASVILTAILAVATIFLAAFTAAMMWQTRRAAQATERSAQITAEEVRLKNRSVLTVNISRMENDKESACRLVIKNGTEAPARLLELHYADTSKVSLNRSEVCRGQPYITAPQEVSVLAPLLGDDAHWAFVVYSDLAKEPRYYVRFFYRSTAGNLVPCPTDGPFQTLDAGREWGLNTMNREEARE